MPHRGRAATGPRWWRSSARRWPRPTGVDGRRRWPTASRGPTPSASTGFDTDRVRTLRAQSRVLRPRRPPSLRLRYGLRPLRRRRQDRWPLQCHDSGTRRNRDSQRSAASPSAGVMVPVAVLAAFGAARSSSERVAADRGRAPSRRHRHHRVRRRTARRVARAAPSRLRRPQGRRRRRARRPPRRPPPPRPPPTTEAAGPGRHEPAAPRAAPAPADRPGAHGPPRASRPPPPPAPPAAPLAATAPSSRQRQLDAIAQCESGGNSAPSTRRATTAPSSSPTPPGAGPRRSPATTRDAQPRASRSCGGRRSTARSGSLAWPGCARRLGLPSRSELAPGAARLDRRDALGAASRDAARRARPGRRAGRSARTSSSTPTRCAGSSGWPGSGPATASSRSAPGSARSPWPSPRPAPTVTAVEVDRHLVPVAARGGRAGTA